MSLGRTGPIMPTPSMSIRIVTKIKLVAARRVVSRIVNHLEPKVHRAINPRAVVGREKIEQKAAETGDQERSERLRLRARSAREPRAELERLQPIFDGGIEEAGEALPVAQRKRV